MVEHVYSVFVFWQVKIVLEQENPRQNQRIGIKGDVSSISFQKKKKMRRGQTFAQEQLGLPGKMGKHGVTLLSEVIAEAMWRGEGCDCDERPNAVINTLKQVLRWRSTKWWQSTQASGMKSDPVRPHKVGTRVWLASSRVCSETSWLPSGPVRRTGRVKEQYVMHLKITQRFATFALDSVNHSTAHKNKNWEKEKC